MSFSKNEYYGAGKHADYKAIRKFNSSGRVLREGDYNLLSNTWKTHYKSVLDDLFSVSEFYLIGTLPKTLIFCHYFS